MNISTAMEDRQLYQVDLVEKSTPKKQAQLFLSKLHQISTKFEKFWQKKNKENRIM